MVIRRSSGGAKEFLEKVSGGPLTFAGLISAIRLSEDETQSAFARRLGISVSHLSDIENGRKWVSPERAARFAKVLGYTERQFVRLSLQDELNRRGLNHMHVNLKVA